MQIGIPSEGPGGRALTYIKGNTRPTRTSLTKALLWATHSKKEEEEQSSLSNSKSTSMKVLLILAVATAALAMPEPPAPGNSYLPPSSNYGPPSSQYGAPSGPGSGFRNGGQRNGGNGRTRAPSGSYGAPSSQYGPPGGGYNGATEDPYAEPASYQFQYEVNDPESGNNFGHKEQREGERAQGEYHVLLPDGRTQIVTYTADERGYMPEVRYEGGGGGGYGRGPAGGQRNGY
ncbi:pro-resilin-like [Hetaerina americana]|uniref:pro-resilin-like n=1 Tax=Hetaerina americana TaxID=62018 RepID=UPI003A7F15BC